MYVIVWTIYVWCDPLLSFGLITKHGVRSVEPNQDRAAQGDVSVKTTDKQHREISGPRTNHGGRAARAVETLQASV